MMTTRTFPATPTQIQSLSTLLAEHNITIDPTQPKGEEKTGGWDVSWTLAPDSITISLIKSPFLESGLFWAKVQSALK
jgi:hypothetical protein